MDRDNPLHGHTSFVFLRHGVAVWYVPCDIPTFLAARNSNIVYLSTLNDNLTHTLYS